MGKKYMFVTDSNGKSHEVKVDPKNVSRQAAEHRSAGREVTVMSEDERIRYGQTANQIRDSHR
ncbi:hypothetical protein [Micromonospora sp. NPDC048843]|uniref:hypothetical protein n=1 Tax=Micromonospora sp. NPDC048843 TaxID=3155389 RepID=UPI0033C6A80B